MKNATIKQNPISDFTSVDTEDRKALSLRAGDTVKVWIKIIEVSKTKGKETTKVRLQPFEGLVISRKHGSEAGATFTVRRSTGGVTVEKIFPLFSPVIDKIEILKQGDVRRSKLYVLRDKTTKGIKRILRKSKIVSLSTKSDMDEAKRVELEKKAEEEAKAAAEKAEADAKVAAVAAEAEKKAEEEVKIKAAEEAAAKKEEEKEEVVEEKEEVKEEVTSEKDDLKKIEGIGPVIEKTLNEAGIMTFAQLHTSSDEATQELIKDVKGNHQAGTWNEQAELAMAGKWDELQKMQDELNRGEEK